MSRLPSLLRGRMAIAVVGGSVLSLYVLLLVASLLDGSFAGSTLGRNLRFAGEPVSGTPTVEVDQLVASLANGFGDTPIEIDAGFGPTHSRADELGLRFDVDDSSRALLLANRPSLLARPFSWLASFVGTNDVAPRYVIDQGQLHTALLDIDLPGITEWRLPSIEADAFGVRVVPGSVGSGVDAEHFSERLLIAAEGDERPLRVTPELVEVVPPVSDEAAAAVAAEAEAATADPLDITVGDVTRTVAVASLRSWIVLDIDGSEVSWDLDHQRVAIDLADRFADVESAGSDVSFVVENGQLNVVPGEKRSRCCVEGSSQRILTALRSGSTRVVLELDSEETAHGSEWARSLGIVEEVASFTTNHPCCQNRVVNIQLMADTVRGVVIEPGQTFSVNDHVGRRTEQKGYLPAGGITNGVMVDQLGGGVSQFTTTLFNAAFFAGLDFGEYQAHSIYFSRYPYGREATLSFPAPDLQIRNTTPYGVLIWPTYTDTSITVTLYSTKHVTAEQTGQSTSEQGVCTRVRTERTRTYDDGREVVDAVFAVYRPREGINCSGESTIPTEPEDEEGEGEGESSTTTTEPATASSTTTTDPGSTSTTSSTSPPPTDPPPPEGG
jgi:vancomycin resistance protein YoaR